MDKAARVSVVLCTFDRADVVERAVASVRAQTARDWELLIVDDGSADGTFERLAPLVREDERLRYLYVSHRGLSRARNAGIFGARGEWITFIDSDDEYAPDHLERRLEFAAAHPTVDCLHGGFAAVDGAGRRRAEDDEAWFVRDLHDPARRIHLARCVIGATIFARAHVFEELGGFDPEIDYGRELFFIERAEKKYAVAKVDFPTYRYYRDRPDSICNRKERELSD